MGASAGMREILSGGFGKVSCWRAASLSGRPSQQASDLELSRQLTLGQMSSRQVRQLATPAPSAGQEWKGESLV